MSLVSGSLLLLYPDIHSRPVTWEIFFFFTGAPLYLEISFLLPAVCVHGNARWPNLEGQMLDADGCGGRPWPRTVGEVAAAAEEMSSYVMSNTPHTQGSTIVPMGTRAYPHRYCC